MNATDPRNAATTLVVRDAPLEVLMLRRAATATFPSALVFPGGVVDPEDADPAWDALVTGTDGLTAHQRAVRIAAIRETWEESGLVVAASGRIDPAADRSRPFLDHVRDAGLILALDELHYFGHWITPEVLAKRWDTRFYLVRAPLDQDADAVGGEMLDPQWLAPAAVLEQEGARLPFPTQSNIHRLAESEDVTAAIAAARERPRFTVRPLVQQVAGGRLVRIPAESGYRKLEQLTES